MERVNRVNGGQGAYVLKSFISPEVARFARIIEEHFGGKLGEEWL